jgi:hypothetical protein
VSVKLSATVQGAVADSRNPGKGSRRSVAAVRIRSLSPGAISAPATCVRPWNEHLARDPRVSLGRQAVAVNVEPEPAASHPVITLRISPVTAASPSRTVASRPSRGDHKVPVALIRGRIHTVGVSARARTLPSQRQSETMMWVAPMAGRCANVSGNGSLRPPSVRRSAPPPDRTATAGKRCGIDALARTTSCNGTV